jgi:hypothetical protein
MSSTRSKARSSSGATSDAALPRSWRGDVQRPGASASAAGDVRDCGEGGAAGVVIRSASVTQPPPSDWDTLTDVLRLGIGRTRLCAVDDGLQPPRDRARVVRLAAAIGDQFAQGGHVAVTGDAGGHRFAGELRRVGVQPHAACGVLGKGPRGEAGGGRRRDDVQSLDVRRVGGSAASRLRCVKAPAAPSRERPSSG